VATVTASLSPGPSPPVVFVAQLGTGGESWQPVLKWLPQASTFVYDRPGTGAAPPRPAPNPALPYSAFARELAGLLDEHGVTEPVVLVGHSVGCLIARVFADRHPARVAGFVAVDGSIPQFRVGELPAESLDGEEPHGTRFDYVAGEVEVMTARVPRVPAVVVSRRPRWWVNDFADIPHPAIDELWQLSQRILADEWHAPLVVADAGHQVPDERPGLVAYLIEAVLHACRTGTAVSLDRARLAETGGTLG
jgi:pimeloyl-ACP methyl ester carboxylesterase